VGFADHFIQVAQRSVAGGYVFALALVCTIQYMYQVYRNVQARRLKERFCTEMQGLEESLQLTQKDRTLTRLENQILREFVSQTELEKALAVLLRRFVPNANDGFGAIVQFDGDRFDVNHSRGLQEESIRNLRIDRDLLDEAQQNGIVVLEDARMRESKLLASLAEPDRDKVRSLFLVAIGEPGDVVGILVTTALFPAGAPREHQLELAGRLMLSVAGNLKRKQTLEQQEHRLRMTSEMLQLRSISDQQFESPLAMFDEFLNRLLDMVAGERAALFLAAADSSRTTRAIVRSGAGLPPEWQAGWQEHEDRLARATVGQEECRRFDDQCLRQIGVHTFIRSALTVPLGRAQNSLGVLCLTKRDQTPFTAPQVELVRWAAEHLGDSLLRAVSQAVVERQAHLDPLTELANRRLFDRKIQHELRIARESGGECSLLLFDLDRFKSVNDHYGHLAGDEVLRVTARILREEVARCRCAKQALTARYGGEELAALLPGCGVEAAHGVAESVRAALAGMCIRFQEHELRVTLSAGIAGFPAHADSVEELIAAADAALYEAKAAGRNRVCSRPEALV
jgi:diguanylate cyclase (GGDEF)-like protein